MDNLKIETETAEVDSAEEQKRKNCIRSRERYWANREELLEKQKKINQEKRIERAGGVLRPPGRPKTEKVPVLKEEIPEEERKKPGRPRKY